jgi:predicted TPR repeat methyltransferase
MMQSGLDDLPALVKKGSPPPPKNVYGSSEDMWVQLAGSLANYARAGAAQQVVEVISALPEFPSFGKMLDLGNGPGIYRIAIVSAHSDMKGVIFHRPAVVKAAETFIKEYDLEDGMDVMGGDYLHDSIGDGYDLV